MNHIISPVQAEEGERCLVVIHLYRYSKCYGTFLRFFPCTVKQLSFFWSAHFLSYLRGTCVQMLHAVCLISMAPFQSVMPSWFKSFGLEQGTKREDVEVSRNDINLTTWEICQSLNGHGWTLQQGPNLLSFSRLTQVQISSRKIFARLPKYSMGSIRNVFQQKWEI